MFRLTSWSARLQTSLTKSNGGSRGVLDFLKTAKPAERKAFIARLSMEERAVIVALLDKYAQNPWAKYQSDPIGFIEQGLGEPIWSKQREILESVRDNKRTAVPACHAPGKSHLAARIVAWWVMSHEIGTAQVVTTATSFRQVRNILWAHIRRLHAVHDLDGDCLMVEWKRGTEMVAFGFAPAAYNETALQGIHAPNLLVVVDEAGGISDTIGVALEALMTGGNTRLLLLGNPPTDNENSWFERACSSDLYNTIQIGAYDTPNFTGEETGVCTTCPRAVGLHSIASHLVDDEWVKDVIQELGAESAFVEARVHARFPKATGNRVIPSTWLDDASINDNPAQSTQIRLGIDIAADGGDEFVIARADGYTARIIHASSGKDNASAIQVAYTCLHHIQQAEADALHNTYLTMEQSIQQFQTPSIVTQPNDPSSITKPNEASIIMQPTDPSSITKPTRGGGAKTQNERGGGPDTVIVKVDAIGLGWGVVSILREWGVEGLHSAKIVGVNVSERAFEAGKFRNQRAEMWWNGRVLCQPDSDGRQVVRLDVDRKVLLQMALPDYLSDSSGRIKIISKADLRRTGRGSPDRAEAILLALYDPRGSDSAPLVTPIGIPQANVWDI